LIILGEYNKKITTAKTTKNIFMHPKIQSFFLQIISFVTFIWKIVLISFLSPYRAYIRDILCTIRYTFFFVLDLDEHLLCSMLYLRRVLVAGTKSGQMIIERFCLPGTNAEINVYMCRVFPKLIPLWLAPLLLPYCKLITPCPALNCSSVKLRIFLSASLGPILGLP